MSKISLVYSQNRYQNIFKSLDLIKDDIAKGLSGKKNLVIKPNLTDLSENYWLSNTHFEALKATLDFITQFYKEKIIIAEGSGGGETSEALKNSGFYNLQKEYDIEFIDLNNDKFVPVKLYNRKLEKNLIQHVAKTILDADYIVSLAVPKTHDSVIVTLGLKNLVVGSLKEKWKDYKFDILKTVHHGPKAINLNLYELSKLIKPDLTILDGFQAMQGNGPVDGTALDWKIALSSTDWLAIDIFTTYLMGFNPLNVGYLYYAKVAKKGESNFKKMNILGEKDFEKFKRKFEFHQTLKQQLNWKIDK